MANMNDGLLPRKAAQDKLREEQDARLSELGRTIFKKHGPEFLGLSRRRQVEYLLTEGGGHLSRAEIGAITGMSRQDVLTHLKTLVDMGRVEMVGKETRVRADGSPYPTPVYRMRRSG